MNHKTKNQGKHPPGVPVGERLGFSISQLARQSSLSRGTIYKLLNSGHLASIQVFGRRIITPDAWADCMALLAKKEEAV